VGEIVRGSCPVADFVLMAVLNLRFLLPDGLPQNKSGKQTFKMRLILRFCIHRDLC
jgi:hypothetical protein